MTISQRQFTLLTEMGISLWQRKSLTTKQDQTKITPSFDKAEKANPENVLETIQKNNQSHHNAAANVNLPLLLQQTVFNDIINSLDLTSEQISQTAQGLQFTYFSWEFTSKGKIITQKQKLITPPLTNIAQSSQLKRQLWQALQELKPC